MTCRDFAEFVWRYRAGELPDEERFEFDAHLAICPQCVAYLETYEATIGMSREAFPDPDAPVSAEVPEDLVRAILAARAKGKDRG